MKIAIIFYSYSGNTRAACEFLKGKLQAGNQVDLLELKLRQEETNFFRQGNNAWSKQAPELLGADYDIMKYDFVIFSSAVWAFTFTPALRAYLNKMPDLEFKKTAIFLTCGSALTSGNALKELENSLTSKKADVLYAAYLTGQRVKKEGYLEGSFKQLIGILDNLRSANAIY